jgi:hypothetical protein
MADDNIAKIIMGAEAARMLNKCRLLSGETISGAREPAEPGDFRNGLACLTVNVRMVTSSIYRSVAAWGATRRRPEAKAPVGRFDRSPKAMSITRRRGGKNILARLGNSGGLVGFSTRLDVLSAFAELHALQWI